MSQIEEKPSKIDDEELEKLAFSTIEKLKIRVSKLTSDKKLTIDVLQVEAHPQIDLSQLPLHPLLSSLSELLLQQQLLFSVLEHKTSLAQDFFERFMSQALAVSGIRNMPNSITNMM